jgi:hypothetical protein
MVFELADFLIIFLTLSIYSLLYKENPFSVLAEHVFVGGAQAFAFITALGFITDYAITPITKGNYLPIIPVVLGLLTYLRYTKTWRWVARFPISISIGVGIGVALRALVQNNVVSQIKATILLSLTNTADPATMLGNILIVLGTITSIMFFYFSRPHTGVLGGTTKVGYYMLYIALGAYFGNVFMGRVALFNGRMTTLLTPDRMYISIGLTIVILVTVYALHKMNLLKKLIGYEK